MVRSARRCPPSLPLRRRFPTPLCPVSTLPPSLSFRSRFILRFSCFSSSCVFSNVRLETPKRTRCRARLVSAVREPTSTSWSRKNSKRGNSIRIDSNRNRVGSRSSRRITYRWFGSRSISSRREAKKKGMATKKREARSKWRVVHAFRSIVGYESRGSCGAPC